ncbi:hypothetical protein [Pseudarthrobacter sp. N5]|uniref:hypothetical protein n=1 Tax=Pseudarthrobacter sp. N5 TaxID=3418416 RepID=UPI003CF83A34
MNARAPEVEELVMPRAFTMAVQPAGTEAIEGFRSAVADVEPPLLVAVSFAV